MMTLLLASYLAAQTWSWVPVSDAVAYRIYFSMGMTTWCAQDRVEVSAFTCTPTECQGEVAEPDFSPAYFVVTAVDAAGNEGPTEHGEVQSCP
jgi:hypothetical protein